MASHKKMIDGTNFYWDGNVLRIHEVAILTIVQKKNKKMKFHEAYFFIDQFKPFFLDEFYRTVPHLFLSEAKAYYETKIIEVFYSKK